MIVLCIESSHTRGMGHLFHSLLYVDFLKSHNVPFLFLINKDHASEQILKNNSIKYINVDFNDTCSKWEKEIISKYKISTWINDKYCSSMELGRHVSETRCKFYVIDDVGEGESYATASFAGMLFPTKTLYRTDRVYKGTEYIILNPEIKDYIRRRDEIRKIIVTLGGSDTYGSTIEVVDALNNTMVNTQIDILIGPGFKFRKELQDMNKKHFPIMQNVPSLIKKFYEYDLAITGGGGTCCEAMASGLPCMIIANENHEVNTGMFFQKKGCCVYLGKHGEWNRDGLKKINNLQIADMSTKGIETFDTNAVKRIFDIILKEDEG